MFRNPRENASRLAEAILAPSTGRPPSPPPSPDRKPVKARPATTPAAMTTRTMSSRSNAVNSAPPPTIGRGSTTPRKNSTPAVGKARGKPNGKPNSSILAFFKKAEAIEDDLFVPEKSVSTRARSREQSETKTTDDIEDAQDVDEPRFQENGGSFKRRRTSGPEQGDVLSTMNSNDMESETAGETAGACSPPPLEAASPPTSIEPTGYGGSTSGPFVEESDSEGEELSAPLLAVPQMTEKCADEVVPPPQIEQVEAPMQPCKTASKTPALSRETTSVMLDGDFDDFQNIDDFEDDVYDEGEEFVERKWMEEQRRLEAEEGVLEEDYDEDDNAQPVPEGDFDEVGDAGAANAPSCPICNISMGSASDQEAAVHVNNCLDGNPTPLPSKDVPSKEESLPRELLVQKEGAAPANRFKRPPRGPKPGQENPFSLGGSNTKGGSAFSKLMSGHAEDAAWATAAAAENSARGKPAYQRTCPFYKILPGFSICVDAFRYGGVEGCRAYFLSHFHSDHYIGLTSTWSHGPIYCSHVTANLVRQQLRVDPKYVVDLDFEETIEVPGTNGVNVTMIPANHCPGSSLYLFEKVTGKGNNRKKQRVLHCGDFRACRAHVEHPLLRPDVVDAVSGKGRQQKLDVCYLDTTYLNPKYAFPCQEEVIKACADMCVSLNKVRADENDGWEQMKRERAGAGMVKFVRKDSSPGIKQEEDDGDGHDAMKVTSTNNSKMRGKLLVIVGTYSIGKERICLGIARALNSKIYAPPGKQRICAALEDPELNSRLTKDPREAQVHMTPLFEIRADTLDDYLKDYKDYFTRAVGFRPSGWNYRPPNSRFVESPSVQTVLHSENWKSTYTMKELVPQRGSTSRASCFGVPYSEHSSFKELTMFCCALRIEKIIPTVNVGSAKGRERMKAWCEKWAADRKKNGLFESGDGSKW